MLKDFPPFSNQDFHAPSSKTDKIIDFSRGTPFVLPQLHDIWKNTALTLVNNADFIQYLSGMKSSINHLYDQLLPFLQSASDLPLFKENVLFVSGLQEVRSWLWHVFGGPRHILILFGLENFEDHFLQPLKEEFVCFRPQLQFDKEDTHLFWYEPQYAQLRKETHIQAIWMSNPNIPTGIQMRSEQLAMLKDMLLGQKGIILIETTSLYSLFESNGHQKNFHIRPQQVYSITFDDIGIQGEQLGMVIADKQIIQRLQAHQASLGLYPSPMIIAMLSIALQQKELERIATDILPSLYSEQKKTAVDIWKQSVLEEIPYYFCKGDHVRHLWVWLRDMPVNNKMLLNLMLKRNVLVGEGSKYFPDSLGQWKHRFECLYLDVMKDEAQLQEGIRILSETINNVYRHKLFEELEDME